MKSCASFPDTEKSAAMPVVCGPLGPEVETAWLWALHLNAEVTCNGLQMGKYNAFKKLFRIRNVMPLRMWQIRHG